MAGFF